MTVRKYNRAKIAAIAGAVFALILICTFYYCVDPASGLMPGCSIRRITGHLCPGCGFQRALHAVLHGHIVEAWHYNAFVFFAVPVAVFYLVAEAGRRHWPRFYARAVHPAIIAAIFTAILAWWVYRW